MPLSSPLILNLVCNTPVIAPAAMPAANPANVASHGDHRCMSKTAVTDAPSVIEPSAVMSGKLKMRKLR